MFKRLLDFFKKKEIIQPIAGIEPTVEPDLITIPVVEEPKVKKVRKPRAKKPKKA